MLKKLLLFAMASSIAIGVGSHAWVPRTEAQEVDPGDLAVITLSPIILDSVLRLVGEASGGVLNPRVITLPTDATEEPNGFAQGDACLLAYALRTATGDAAGAAELNGNGNALPCEATDNIATDAIQPEDFELLGPLDAEQISENSETARGGLIFVVFGNDQEPMHFSAPDGHFYSQGGLANQGSNYLCDTVGEDPDCIDVPPGATPDDNFVIAHFSGPFANRGEMDVTITQGEDESVVTLNVVGDPVGISSILNLDPRLEVGGGEICRDGGDPDAAPLTFADLLSITELSPLPSAGLALANVVDSDGTQLANVPVEWDSDDENIVIPGFLNQFSLLNSGLTIGPNLLCSGEERGTTTVRALVRRSANWEDNVGQVRASTEVTVVGRPAQMVVFADPPFVDCNGTNSSTITAQLLDAFSVETTTGRQVTFDVQTLGTANPIVAETGGTGAATSVVTPLVEGISGVTVTVIGPLDLEQQIIVECFEGLSGGTAPPPPGGGGAPTGTIRPPDTGSAGDLDGHGALSTWMAVGLFAGAMGLVGARLALRRVD